MCIPRVTINPEKHPFYFRFQNILKIKKSRKPTRFRDFVIFLTNTLCQDRNSLMYRLYPHFFVFLYTTCVQLISDNYYFNLFIRSHFCKYKKYIDIPRNSWYVNIVTINNLSKEGMSIWHGIMVCIVVIMKAK